MIQFANKLVSSVKKAFHQEEKDMHQQARDWEASQTLVLMQSESRAWKIAGVSTALTALSVTSLVVMLPFYKVIPMTFLVDKATGAAQLVDTSMAIPMISEQWDKHWVEEYVNSRERYNWMLLQYDHDKTMALSGDAIAKTYDALYQGANSIDKQLGNYTERRIHIVTSTLPPSNPGTAVVRFERSTRERGLDIEIGAEYIATLSYTYQKPTLRTLEKNIVANPSGFKVTGYVVDKVNKSINSVETSPAAQTTSNGEEHAQ